MKDEIQSYRKTTWSVDEAVPMPHLYVIRPWGMEGTYDIIVPGRGKQMFYLDHGWDGTFGFAFGEIRARGEEAARLQPEVAVGDFVHFTRCAYESAKDKEGRLRLFVNWRDVICTIDHPGLSQGAAFVEESGNYVDAS